MKTETNYFTLTTDSDQVIAVIQNNGKSKDFKEAIETAVLEHFSLDRADITNINVNDFIGQEKEVKVKCLDENEDTYFEDINVVSVLMYGKIT